MLATGVLGAGVCSAPAVLAAPVNASGDVVKVRLGGDATQTRIVIELDRAVDAKVVTRDSETTQQIIALPDVEVGKALSGTGMGLIADWKVESIAGSTRLKLNFKGQGKIYRRFLLPPADGISVYRYVVDIVPGNADTAVEKPSPVPVIAAPASGKTQMASNTSRKKVIVIDAGHGGKDPGALGGNSYEKDVNLAAARTLKASLEKTGRYTVIMTRETDSFVDLPARVRIARNANADLFISLHSDAGGNGETRGASIYTLSDSGTERAARKALVKGDWSLPDMPQSDAVVSRILIDLTQRATKNRSATFAQLVMDHISASTPLLKTNLRQAGLFVLLAPDVPAVLLEMGFVNNKEDEAMLSDPRHREIMMGQVARAIDVYFANEVRYASFAGLP
ncbi:N-acetylmuramoyl-L-alanine amidase family protein [Asticcacaulis biprosthecium C19]|uniref:N-acetylmuramoyl-L-alanine amidase n=1 Tax=Asticcacaulis biprosthecium C19 TaxID=715226 RepID=F4QQA5_9CAUL|nr:N-acetylmuramoyl-L-alanine amidase family protein [Asticcacaulis biprosthecium C19]